MKFDCNMYIHPTQARGLTPREAARLQGFPENYKVVVSYTQLRQQAGNSVSVPVIKAVAEKMIEALKAYDLTK